MQRSFGLLATILTMSGLGLWAGAVFFSEQPGAGRGEVTGASEMAEEVERSRSLDHALQASMRDREERYAVIARLEREEICLDDAIAQFREMNVDDLRWMVLRRHLSDRSDDEVIGYQLVAFANSMPRNDEAARQKFLVKLVAQLRDNLGATRVVLPPHVRLNPLPWATE